ncbi:hypothetical protein MOB78_12695 [Bacillus spizizenii]|nr:hypothetical protein [Bacillus spizizenii]
MRKRYRYITNGLAIGENKLSDFRLIAANSIKPSYDGAAALRVNIPSDVELTKYSCDSYSTTEDERTLDELGYDILIWYQDKRKWKVHNEFKGTRLCDISLSRQYLQLTYDPLFISRFVIQRYVEKKIEGNFYLAKQFACYEFIRTMEDEELEEILIKFMERENLESITFEDWAHDAEIIWDIIFSYERYKSLEFGYKKSGFGETGLGVIDKSDNTFYDCAFACHWQKVMDIVREKYPEKHKALETMYFNERLNEVDGVSRSEMDSFIMERFQLVGENKQLDDYIG